MEDHPCNPGTLAFGEFLVYLSQQGLTIGVDHHLRLQQLLRKIEGRCAPQDLKTLLCPIFATDPTEQALFYRAFDTYFEVFQDDAGTKKAAGLSADGSHRGWIPIRARLKRYRLVFVIVGGLIVIAAIYWALRSRDGQELAVPIVPEVPKAAPPSAPVSQSNPAGVVAPPVNTPPQPAPASPRQTSSTRSASTFVIVHQNAVRLAAVLVPLVGFLLYEWLRLRRRNLILERARGRRPPYSWPIRVEAPKLKDFSSETFYRAARFLRRRQIGEFQRVDVARTIDATITACGYPVFRFRPDSRPPEYLALIDRASFRDHQAHLFEQLVRALDKEGLFIVRYFFDADPRICWSEMTGGAIHLADLQKRYPEHRLLLFGDGEMLIDPLSGRLASWAALVLEWQDRAVLTLASPPSWGMREKTLAEHFIVLPAVLEHLADLSDRFEAPVRSGARRRTQDDSDSLPPQSGEPATIELLERDLDEGTFQWLCACAVYPELHWDMTLYLGSLPCMPKGLVREKHLLKLISLPWFRSGSIPDEWRVKLIGKLDPTSEEVIRSSIIELLEKNPAPAGSVAARQQQLDLVTQRSWLNRRDRQKLSRTLQPIKGLPLEELNRDYALVRFLETASVSP